MNSINEKEKKLNIALDELKNLDLSNPNLQKIGRASCRERV